MQRQNIVILQREDMNAFEYVLEAWGSLKRACNAHPDFQYHSIKMKKFPFEHKGWIFRKVPFAQVA